MLETTAVDETTDHWRLPADSSRTHACLLQSCRSYRTSGPRPETSSCSSEHRSHSTAVSTGGHTIHCTNMRTVKLDVIGEANQCCVAPGRAMNTSTRVSASIHVDTHRHTHRDTDTHTHTYGEHPPAHRRFAQGASEHTARGLGRSRGTCAIRLCYPHCKDTTKQPVHAPYRRTTQATAEAISSTSTPAVTCDASPCNKRNLSIVAAGTSWSYPSSDHLSLLHCARPTTHGASVWAEPPDTHAQPVNVPPIAPRLSSRRWQLLPQKRHQALQQPPSAWSLQLGPHRCAQAAVSSLHQGCVATTR